MLLPPGTPDWGRGTLLENIEPTEELELFVEDTCDGNPSLLEPERILGLRSDEDDDGAKVTYVDPTA